MARLLFACCLFVSIACGPSLKQGQRSVEYYEQCYGADYDPMVTPDQRRNCWRTWLSDYAEEQPPERIRYAEMRVAQLTVDGSTRPLPDPQPAIATPIEHKYPRQPPTQYQTSGCDLLCNDRWAGCITYCELRDKACTAACESEFRVCKDGCP